MEKEVNRAKQVCEKPTNPLTLLNNQGVLERGKVPSKQPSRQPLKTFCLANIHNKASELNNYKVTLQQNGLSGHGVEKISKLVERDKDLQYGKIIAKLAKVGSKHIEALIGKVDISQLLEFLNAAASNPKMGDSEKAFVGNRIRSVIQTVIAYENYKHILEKCELITRNGNLSIKVNVKDSWKNRSMLAKMNEKAVLTSDNVYIRVFGENVLNNNSIKSDEPDITAVFEDCDRSQLKGKGVTIVIPGLKTNCNNPHITQMRKAVGRVA